MTTLGAVRARHLPTIALGRWYRPLAFGLTVVILAAAVLVAWIRFTAFDAAGAVAGDYHAFILAGQRLLAGSPFQPYQLAGPYSALAGDRSVDQVPFLYPPPYALVGIVLGAVPAFLWWALPLALLGYLIAWWRPEPWAWPVMAAILVWPATSSVVITGGTTMWVVALTAAGLRWHWPAALILLKPSFLPVALIGIRHRSWWIAVGILGLVSLAMLPLWFDYLTAMRNASDVRPWYSVGDLPFILLPIVAWAARCRPQGRC